MEKIKHPFERAGLGKAPFHCVGCRENWFVMEGCGRKPGGSCNYCGTGILYEFVIRSSDGAEFVVGSDCVEKTGGQVEGFREERLKMAREKRALKVEGRRKEREAQWAKERAERIAANAVDWLADHADLDAQLKAYAGNNEFIKDMARAVVLWGRLTGGQIGAVQKSLAREAERERKLASAKHVGSIGKRMAAVVKCVFSKHLGTSYFNGYPSQRYIVKFETVDGNDLTWFGSYGCIVSDKEVTIKFTPKEFEVYQGIPQTIIQRVKEIES